MDPVTRQLSQALNVTEANLLAFQQSFKKYAQSERTRLLREKQILDSMPALSNMSPIVASSQIELAKAAEKELDVILGVNA